MSQDGGIPGAADDIMVGVPADILRRRPDVRRAERLLASQTALIGVAKADLYPTFSISGFVQSVAGAFSGMFQGDGSSIGWGVIPGFRWDLFKGGKIRNNIRAQEARTDQALLGYQQTILLAFEEVEDAMVAYDRERVRRARLQEAADASQRAVDLVLTVAVVTTGLGCRDLVGESSFHSIHVEFFLLSAQRRINRF